MPKYSIVLPVTVVELRGATVEAESEEEAKRKLAGMEVDGYLDTDYEDILDVEFAHTGEAEVIDSW